MLWGNVYLALLHFLTLLLLLMTQQRKRGLMLYRSPNPNPKGVQKCNSAAYIYYTVFQRKPKPRLCALPICTKFL